MTININELKEGKYTYQMPEWKEPLNVTIERDSTNNLFIRFKELFRPSPIRDIPANAIMKCID